MALSCNITILKERKKEYRNWITYILKQSKELQYNII